MTRKCSMCGSYKQESEFRYMKKQDRYNCYCKNCEKLYNKEYQRIYRERMKKEEEVMSKADNKELEEAVKTLKRLVEFYNSEEYDCYEALSYREIEAIETVLKKLKRL